MLFQGVSPLSLLFYCRLVVCIVYMYVSICNLADKMFLDSFCCSHHELRHLYTEAMTPDPLCFTEGLVCLGSWVDSLFLPILAFPSLWYRLFSVLSVRNTTFAASLCISAQITIWLILTADDWLTSRGVCSIVVFETVD